MSQRLFAVLSILVLGSCAFAAHAHPAGTSLGYSTPATGVPGGSVLHRAGDLLYHDPRAVPWLIQDRIAPPAKPLGSRFSVDLTSQMPPVGDQGQQGSCVAWAMGYYHKTHNEWIEHHWNDSLTQNQASPAFVYNQICGGEDQGAFFEDAGKLMCEQGAGSMHEFPYSDQNCTNWPPESVYLHGISWRCDSSYWIDIANDAGINRVKARLDSGLTSTLGIWVWGNFDNIQNYSYTYCASQLTGSNRGGHAVTFVGYDDSKVTADGTGAFRMVNSWGTGWGQSGYFWMSYQAVKDTDAQGTHGITQGAAYYVTDKPGYTPTLLGRVKIAHNFRDCVEIRLGVGRTSSPLWTKNFRDFDMRQYNVVPQAFPGNNMVFDMTDGASYLTSGSTDSVFVRCLDDSSDSRAGTIKYFSGQYVPWGVTGVSRDTPVSIPDYNSAVYARAMLPVGQDVGCTRLIAPAGALDSGTAVTPACSTYNYGTTTATYVVRMKIGTGYNQTANVSNQSPGTRTYVTFPSWSAKPRGSLAVTCSTELATDTNHANDRQTGSVQVNVHDVGCTRLLAPAGDVDSGNSVTPACSLYNYGTGAESYTVRMRIGTFYNQAESVSSHAAGTRIYVTFPDWSVQQSPGTYAARCSTELATDQVRTNNRATDSVQVQPPPVHDVGCTRILAPAGTIDSGAVLAPACSVYNFGNRAESYSVRMRIGSVYDTIAAVTNHAAGTRVMVTFPSFKALAPGSVAVTCSTELAADADPANDGQTGSVTVVVHDVGAIAIIAPAGGIDSGTVVTPQAIARNFGTVTENFKVRFLIQPAYVDSQTVDLAAGATDTVSFADWIASPLGWLTAKCTTLLAGDLNPANDLVQDSVLVSPLTAMEAGQPGLPRTFALDEPKPNPFTQQTMIRYALPRTSHVALRVYSASGKLLRTLANGSQPPGYHSLLTSDYSLPEGIYLLRAEFGSVSFTRKLVKIQ